MNVAIVSDSHSGITKHDITGTNIFIIQIPIMVNNDIRPDMETISFSMFDKMVYNNYTLECTSPNENAFKEIWNYLLKIKQYDYVIHIPYSSELGNMYDFCKNLASSYSDRVIVLDTKRLGVALKSLLFTARKLSTLNISTDDLINIINETSGQYSLYMMIGEPKFVKNNCKLDMTKDAYNSLNSPKPIFQMDDGVIDIKAKCRNQKQGIKTMLKALDKDLKTKFKEFVDNKEIEIFIAYSTKIEDGVNLKETLTKKYPEIKITYTDQLPICLCTNLGLNTLMVGCSRIFNYQKIK